MALVCQIVPAGARALTDQARRIAARPGARAPMHQARRIAVLVEIRGAADPGAATRAANPAADSVAVPVDLAAAARDPAAPAVPRVLVVAVAAAAAAAAGGGDESIELEFNHAHAILDRLDCVNGRTECRGRVHRVSVADSTSRRTRCGNSID